MKCQKEKYSYKQYKWGGTLVKMFKQIVFVTKIESPPLETLKRLLNAKTDHWRLASISELFQASESKEEKNKEVVFDRAEKARKAKRTQDFQKKSFNKLFIGCQASPFHCSIFLSLEFWWRSFPMSFNSFAIGKNTGCHRITIEGHRFPLWIHFWPDEPKTHHTCYLSSSFFLLRFHWPLQTFLLAQGCLPFS